MVQVNQEYVSHYELGGAPAFKLASQKWKMASTADAKRRRGEPLEKQAPVRPPKKRRVKAYITIMETENMLNVSAGKSLVHNEGRLSALGAVVMGDRSSSGVGRGACGCDSHVR